MLPPKPKPFICKGCMDIIEKPMQFSKHKDYCVGCYEEKKIFDLGICKICGGENPVKQYWGECEKCWEQGVKEMEELNKRITKEDELEDD
jgi:ribosomal protein L40E